MADIDWDNATDAVLHQAVRNSRLPLCLSDPNQSDNPIIYANKAFYDLTQFTPEEVIGKNCRFLQGPETTAASLDEMRAAIRERKVATIEVVNYRKDGSAFINAVQLGPIYDVDGTLTHFFGSQLDISELVREKAEIENLVRHEQRHRLGNIINVLMVLTRMTGQNKLSHPELVEKIVKRIEAVGRVHMDTLSSDDGDKVSTRELMRKILPPYGANEQRNFTFEGPDFVLRFSAITLLTLLLHELAINAVKHGALGRVDGHVTLNWAQHGDMLHLDWVESGGPTVSEPERESGSRLVRRLIQSSGGEVRYDWQRDGLRVKAEVPTS